MYTEKILFFFITSKGSSERALSKSLRRLALLLEYFQRGQDRPSESRKQLALYIEELRTHNLPSRYPSDSSRFVVFLNRLHAVCPLPVQPKKSLILCGVCLYSSAPLLLNPPRKFFLSFFLMFPFDEFFCDRIFDILSVLLV